MSSSTLPDFSARARLHIPALDGARGFAVLLVLLDHASDAEFLGPFDFNRAGSYGVMLFFTLSAFLLAYLFFSEKEDKLHQQRIWLNYGLRRVLRIFPLFILALVCWAGLHSNFGAGDVVNHLLLRDGQRHFWTIAVEFKFYFVLPALVFVVGVLWHKSRTLAVTAAIALAAFLRFGLKSLEATWSSTNDVWLNEYLEIFLLGTLAGWAFAKLRNWESGFRKVRWAFELCAWACLGVAVLRIPAVYTTLFRPESPVKNFPNNIDFFAVLWPLFLLGTLYGSGGMRKVLTFAPLRWLGLVSYSAYLWHPFLLPYVKDFASSQPIRLLVFFSLVLLVSAASYFLIERPFSKMRLASRIQNGLLYSGGKPCGSN